MYVLKFTPRERVLSVFSNHLILALSYESLSCDNDTEQSCAVRTLLKISPPMRWMDVHFGPFLEFSYILLIFMVNLQLPFKFKI